MWKNFSKMLTEVDDVAGCWMKKDEQLASIIHLFKSILLEIHSDFSFRINGCNNIFKVFCRLIL